MEIFWEWHSEDEIKDRKKTIINKSECKEDIINQYSYSKGLLY